MTSNENTALQIGAQYAEAKMCIDNAISALKHITHHVRLDALDIEAIRKIIDSLDEQRDNISLHDAARFVEKLNNAQNL